MQALNKVPSKMVRRRGGLTAHLSSGCGGVAVHFPGGHPNCSTRGHPKNLNRLSKERGPKCSNPATGSAQGG